MKKKYCSWPTRTTMANSRQSSILEDFFLNFRHQYQQPTDFPFYRIPASLLDTLDVFTDML